MIARILLADDHDLVRAGMRLLLQKIAGVEVVGEANDGREAVAMVATLQPEIVFMDIAMGGMNGLEAASRIMRDHPAVRVVMLSMHQNAEYVLRVLRMGAAGYLLKDASPQQLEQAIRSVMRGERYLDPALARHVTDYRERVEEGPRGLERLTDRQREVLQLLAEGATTHEIAQRLGISVKTVESHRANLMERLEIYELAGLVRFAIREGLILPDE